MIIITFILSLISADISGQWSIETKVDQNEYGLKYFIDFTDGDGKFFRIISTDYETNIKTIITGDYRISNDSIHFHGKEFNKSINGIWNPSIRGSSWMHVRFKFEDEYLKISFKGEEYQNFIYGNPLGRVIHDDRQF